MSSDLILVVEEDEATRTFLADQLGADGFEVLVGNSREHALRLLSMRQPRLVLADLNGQTLGLLDTLRAGDGLAADVDPNTPMIVLSAHADELHRVRVLDRGGDDVIAKPFSYTELRARVRALLRRAYAPRHAPVSRLGTLRVDHRAREARVGERRVKLAPKELGLLKTLIAEPARVFTRAELLGGVWGSSVPSRTLDSTACRLRRKLAAAGPDRRLVVNMVGVGYRLADPDAVR